MRTQPPIEAEESHVGLLRPRVLHEHLRTAAVDRRARADLYTSLLVGNVYAASVSIMLDVVGPGLEFDTTPTSHGPAVRVYTTRARIDAQTDVEPLPFAFLLHALPKGVAIVIDAEHEHFVIDAYEVSMLRDCATLDWH